MRIEEVYGIKGYRSYGNAINEQLLMLCSKMNAVEYKRIISEIEKDLSVSA